MKYDNIAIYLEKLRQFCFADGEHLLKVPMDGDWSMEHMQQAITEALDIIFDYEKATAQTAELLQKYEAPKNAIMRGNGNFATWQCPDCQQFIGYGNEHCHWCGRKLSWEYKYKRRKKT